MILEIRYYHVVDDNKEVDEVLLAYREEGMHITEETSFDSYLKNFFPATVQIEYQDPDHIFVNNMNGRAIGEITIRRNATRKTVLVQVFTKKCGCRLMLARERINESTDKEIYEHFTGRFPNNDIEIITL